VTTTPTAIRHLGPGDLSGLVDLAARVGWMDERRRYTFLLAVGDVYGVDDPDAGCLIGTVTLTRFDPSFAALGMMLVDRRTADEVSAGR
jgi:hypothetical protein